MNMESDPEPNAQKINAGIPLSYRLKSLMWRIMRNDAMISEYLHIRTQGKKTKKKMGTRQ